MLHGILHVQVALIKQELVYNVLLAMHQLNI